MNATRNGWSDRGAEDGGLQLKAAIGALRRRKWVMLASVALGLGLAVALTLLIAPRYTASASIIVGPHAVRLFDQGTAKTDRPQGDGGSLAEDQLKVLGSRSNVEYVIQTLGLAGDPEFDTAALGVRLARRWRAVVRPAWFRSSTVTAENRSSGAAPEQSHRTPEAVFHRVFDRLSFRREGQSNVLTATFTSTDPVKAARVANAIVDAYVNGNLAQQQAVNERARQSIEKQLDQLREEVEQSDRSVEAYRAAHQLTDPANGDLAAQELSRLKAELVNTRTDRIAKDARVREIQDLRTMDRGYKPVTELASSPIVADLLQRQEDLLRQDSRLTATYGDKHPLVLQAKAELASISHKLDQEVGNIIHNFESEAAVARARELALTQAIDRTTEQFANDASAGIQLHELEREARSKRSVYEETLVRLQQINAEQRVMEPDALVISSAAVPNEPSFPRMGTMVAAGVVAALAFGTGLVALLERFNDGLHTGRQVEEMLGIPDLGLLPRIRSLERRATVGQYVFERPLSAYADAIKSMFMRVHPSGSGAVPPQVVLVTSTLPGEGKTTLAISLGAVLARAGHKTIVIDLDVRHPGIALELGEPVELGLVELLAQKRQLDEVVREHPKDPNLHLLPAIGAAGAAEVLTPGPIALLLNDLRARYEYIVLDSAPILGFSDTGLAARLADAVLFVIQWEKTSERFAAHGLDALLKINAPVAGAALTQVDIRRHHKYRYGDVGQYYGRYLTSYEN